MRIGIDKLQIKQEYVTTRRGHLSGMVHAIGAFPQGNSVFQKPALMCETVRKYTQIQHDVQITLKRESITGVKR